MVVLQPAPIISCVRLCQPRENYYYFRNVKVKEKEKGKAKAKAKKREAETTNKCKSALLARRTSHKAGRLLRETADIDTCNYMPAALANRTAYVRVQLCKQWQSMSLQACHSSAITANDAIQRARRKEPK